MLWSTRHAMQSHGAQLRDQLMRALSDLHAPAQKGKVVSLRQASPSRLQDFLDHVLLTEPVQIYFATQKSFAYAGLPLSQAIEQACEALAHRRDRLLDEVLNGEVRTAITALQLFDAAIDSCTPPVGEPRIESILDESHETLGLRIPQEENSVIVTPGSFMHSSLSFTTSDPIIHPEAWFRIREAELEAEALN